MKYLTNSEETMKCEMNKCNQQWKHPETSEEMKTWRNENIYKWKHLTKTMKIMMKIPKISPKKTEVFKLAVE